MDALEFLGKLAYAKRSVEIAHAEIDRAMQRVIERESEGRGRGGMDLSSYVNQALASLDIAKYDLQALVGTMKSV